VARIRMRNIVYPPTKCVMDAFSGILVFTIPSGMAWGSAGKLSP
jgi:tRNA G37 N-methylase Trm5